MVSRIGNTAESQVPRKGAGLDERQAASLLSAVGGHGLSLVESGPATDPAGAGLALQRMYEAWRLTQPQLFWTDQNLWGLDEPGSGAARLVEPAHATAIPLGGGLAETFNGDGGNHIQVARRPQEGA